MIALSDKLSYKERVRRIIKRLDVDYIPSQIDFAPILLDKLASVWNLPKGEEGLLKVINNHIVYAYLNDVFGNIRFRTYDTKDNIKYDDWNVGWDVNADGTCLRYHPIAKISDIDKYVFPNPAKADLMKLAKRTCDKYGKDYFVCSYQNLLLFERAWSLRGIENFMQDMLINKDFAKYLLDKITDYQVAVAKKYVEIGVDCGRTGDDYGMQHGMIISPNMWREFFKPRLQKIWDVYLNANLPIMHHTCGDVRLIMGDMIEMGLSILHPVQPEAMPLEEVKKQFGEKLTFYGGVSTQKTLPFGSPKEIEQEVDRCFSIMGSNGGYILGPSHTLTEEIPIENIIAFINATKKYIL